MSTSKPTLNPLFTLLASRTACRCTEAAAVTGCLAGRPYNLSMTTNNHAHFSTRAISFCAACGTSRQALCLLSRKGSTGRCQERKYSGDQSSRTHGVEIAELTGVNRYDMLREDENERDCLISRPWIEESCCDTFITKLS